METPRILPNQTPTSSSWVEETLWRISNDLMSIMPLSEQNSFTTDIQRLERNQKMLFDFFSKHFSQYQSTLLPSDYTERLSLTDEEMMQNFHEIISIHPPLVQAFQNLMNTFSPTERDRWFRTYAEDFIYACVVVDVFRNYSLEFIDSKFREKMYKRWWPENTWKQKIFSFIESRSLFQNKCKKIEFLKVFVTLFPNDIARPLLN